MAPDDNDDLELHPVGLGDSSLARFPGVRGDIRGRLVEVERQLCCGLSGTRVVEQAMAAWGVSERTAYRYVSLVYAAWERDSLEAARTDRERLRQYLWNCAADAQLAGDYKAAASLAAQIAKVVGANAPEKHMHAVAVGGELTIQHRADPREMTPEERQRELAELEQERERCLKESRERVRAKLTGGKG